MLPIPYFSVQTAPAWCSLKIRNHIPPGCDGTVHVASLTYKSNTLPTLQTKTYKTFFSLLQIQKLTTNYLRITPHIGWPADFRTHMQHLWWHTSGIAAASTHGIPSGTGMQHSCGATQYSAHPPPGSKAITESPTLKRSTPCPTSVTTPATSNPAEDMGTCRSHDRLTGSCGCVPCTRPPPFWAACPNRDSIQGGNSALTIC